MNNNSYSIKEFNKNFDVEQALETFIPGKYKYIKTCSNGQKRYLYSGAKDDCPNAVVTKSGKFVCYHMSDVIGYRNSMTAFDIVKKYICNDDSKETYKYLVNQGYIQNSTSHLSVNPSGANLEEENWKVRNLANIDVSSIEPISWIVEGLIPRNMVCLFFGSGQSGKTTLLHSMCKNIVEQIDFCERKINFSKDEKIILFQAPNEDTGNAVALRLEKMGINPECKDRIIIVEPQTDISIETFQTYMSKIIKENNAKLLVVDSAIDLMGGRDDNASTVVNTILLTLSAMAQKLECAIILIHHSRKRSKDGNLSNSVDDLLGSQRWSSGSRLVIKTSLDKKNRTTTLTIVKENIFGLCSAEEQNKFDGELTIVADEQMNFSFKSFKPSCEITEEKTTQNLETYNKILEYVSSTPVETLKQKFSESGMKGHWAFLCKEVDAEYSKTFATAAKLYFDKNFPDIAALIAQIKNADIV